MRLCLAGTFPAEKIVKEYRPEYVLESFFYIRPWQIEEIPKWKMFLLDSGAFTFMHGIEASSKPVDWDGYLSRYRKGRLHKQLHRDYHSEEVDPGLLRNRQVHS